MTNRATCWRRSTIGISQLGFDFLCLFLVLVLKAAYDLSYIFLVSPYFSWTATTYPLSPNPVKIIESYGLSLIIALMLPCRLKKPSDFVILFFAFTLLLPMSTLYGFADKDRAYMYMAVVMYFVVLGTNKHLPRFKIPTFRSGRGLARLTAWSFVIATTFALIQIGGFDYFNLRFWDYATMVTRRWEIQSRVQETGILAYLYFWLFIVFLPMLIMLSLVERKYMGFFALTMFQFLLTGITARRHTLLVLPELLWTYMLVRKMRVSSILMPLGFTGVVAIASLLFFCVQSLNFVGPWMERYFFAPARINFGYYEFFSQFGYVYLSSTKLGLTPYPFEMIPERMVGYYVFNNPETVASAGILATSYMHFGFGGMVIFGIITGSLMRLVDSLIIKRTPLEVGVPLCIVIFDGLFRGADLTTWFLTFGGFVGLVMLFLLGERRA